MKGLIIAGVAAMAMGAAGGTGFRLATAPKTPAVALSARSVEAAGSSETAEELAAVESAATGTEMTDATTAGGAAAAASDAPEATPGREGAPSDSASVGTSAAASASVDAAADPSSEEAAPAAVDEADASRPGPPAPGTGLVNYSTLAKILGTMKPAEAARIMEHMTDKQVSAVISSMNARSAGPILALFPPDRAAAIGGVLAGETGAEKK